MYYWRRICLVLFGLAGSVYFASLLAISCRGMLHTQTGQLPLSFPYAIADTPLEILGIVGYEGAYVEGNDEEVVDVAALMVSNRSSESVLHAKIILDCGKECFCFNLFYLPPGESVMVLETHEKIWDSQQVYHCRAEYALSNTFNDTVEVGQTADGVLLISNLTDKPIRDVRIYHKNWSKEAGMYIGGVAYETYIKSLQPGQLILLRPHHFVPGISRIVYVTSK